MREPALLPMIRNVVGSLFRRTACARYPRRPPRSTPRRGGGSSATARSASSAPSAPSAASPARSRSTGPGGPGRSTGCAASPASSASKPARKGPCAPSPRSVSRRPRPPCWRPWLSPRPRPGRSVKRKLDRSRSAKRKLGAGARSFRFALRAPFRPGCRARPRRFSSVRPIRSVRKYIPVFSRKAWYLPLCRQSRTPRFATFY